MDLLGQGKLDDFCRDHADVRSQIEAWIHEVKEAEWRTPGDIKARYVSASFISDKRVVFNLKGNKYRLDTKVYYERNTVLVMRIGTHAEYATWRFEER